MSDKTLTDEERNQLTKAKACYRSAETHAITLTTRLGELLNIIDRLTAPPKAVGVDADWLVDTIAHCVTGNFDEQMFRSALKHRTSSTPPMVATHGQLTQAFYMAGWADDAGELATVALSSGALAKVPMRDEVLAVLVKRHTSLKEQCDDVMALFTQPKEPT